LKNHQIIFFKPRIQREAKEMYPKGQKNNRSKQKKNNPENEKNIRIVNKK
jgi:hypothetical protein